MEFYNCNFIYGRLFSPFPFIYAYWTREKVNNNNKKKRNTNSRTDTSSAHTRNYSSFFFSEYVWFNFRYLHETLWFHPQKKRISTTTQKSDNSYFHIWKYDLCIGMLLPPCNREQKKILVNKIPIEWIPILYIFCLHLLNGINHWLSNAHPTGACPLVFAEFE